MGRASDFDELYHAWFDIAYEAAWDVLQSHLDAEDVVQRLFIRLWHTAAWRTICHPRQFFREAGRREAVSLLRYRQIRPWTVSLDLVAARALEAVPPVAHDALERAEERATAARLISYLPQRCKAACTLVYLAGLTHGEVAERLGITRKAVGKQVARGRRLMREWVASALDGAAMDRRFSRRVGVRRTAGCG